MTNVMTSKRVVIHLVAHTFGRQANQLLRECRQIIAEYLNVNSREIIFTSGGTGEQQYSYQRVCSCKSAKR